AAEQRDEFAPFHQQFLPCFKAEDSTAGDLLHCGISKELLSAVGQTLPIRHDRDARPMSASPPIAVKHWHRSETPLRAISDISHRSGLTRRAALHGVGERFVSDPSIRGNRQPFAYVIAQLLFRVLRQFGDHLALWPDRHSV